ncbi:MAG: HDOD domain-containing protein [Oxalicibacterium faecigallinarum]|uniref:Phosphohydrolase n=1 Tax=Oxalicibacterium faecigallinarum TaxID=573741 RepID=A0A8J3F174_9BURK|nr:HDOD domain-containing protein [Oxalicibacterium faecigallinarum]MDQ7970365.1 HDOD domain-containing protein [Oxalicibacterium faecigallinarum]GGI18752.1 phosphohydrolase [Oxalicibacterium faecigallinarum]
MSANPAGHMLHFDQVLRQIRDLPALPAIVQDLVKNMTRDDADIHLIANKVSQDQALSAKTLRFANSSFYGLQSRVTTIQQAITLIGVDAVKHVVTTAALTGYFPAGHVQGLDLNHLWRHSIATAVCARVLARHLHVNQEYAFTAGLLHDIGRLVLATYFRREYEAVIAYRNANDCHWIDAEHAVIGVDYVSTGVALATHWNFSESIRNAIAGHYRPENQKVHSLASIVHIANAIVRALDLSHQENDLVPPVSATSWDDLGLSDETYLHVFHETEIMFEDVCRVLLADA